MSQENVEVVKRFESLMVPSLEEEHAHGAGGGFDEVLKLLHPSVAFHASRSIPHGGDYVGHERFLQMCEQFRELWDLEGGVELEYLDAGEDRVITIASFTITSRHTGRSAPVRMVEVVTVRDGKIVELQAYYEDTAPIVVAGGGVLGRFRD
jgi:ketosteroid isomerase-like protein